MAEDKFHDELDALYKQLLAPPKGKFVTEVRKRIANGSLKDAPRNWLVEIGNYLDGINATVFTQPPKREGHYDYGGVDFALIIDLMDVAKIAKKNKGYNWILNVIEGHSRFAWSFVLHTKSSVETDKEGNNAIGKDLDEIFDLLIPGHDGKDYPEDAISPSPLPPIFSPLPPISVFCSYSALTQ